MNSFSKFLKSLNPVALIVLLGGLLFGINRVIDYGFNALADLLKSSYAIFPLLPFILSALCICYAVFIVIYIIYRWIRFVRETKTEEASSEIPHDLSPGYLKVVAGKVVMPAPPFFRNNRSRPVQELTAELLQMAIQGIITIEHQASSEKKDYLTATFTFTRVPTFTGHLSALQKTILLHLFTNITSGDENQPLTITAEYPKTTKKERSYIKHDPELVWETTRDSRLTVLLDILNTKLFSFFIPHYFGYHMIYLFVGVASLILALPAMGELFENALPTPLTIGIIMLVSVVTALGSALLVKQFTTQGRHLIKAIKSFKMFLDNPGPLDSAEPDAARKRYEQFLVYALVCSKEEEWAHHFEQAAPDEARNYRIPTWYQGPLKDSCTPFEFPTELENALTATIAYAARVGPFDVDHYLRTYRGRGR